MYCNNIINVLTLTLIIIIKIHDQQLANISKSRLSIFTPLTKDPQASIVAEKIRCHVILHNYNLNRACNVTFILLHITLSVYFVSAPC